MSFSTAVHVLKVQSRSPELKTEMLPDFFKDFFNTYLSNIRVNSENASIKIIFDLTSNIIYESLPTSLDHSLGIKTPLCCQILIYSLLKCLCELMLFHVDDRWWILINVLLVIFHFSNNSFAYYFWVDYFFAQFFNWMKHISLSKMEHFN